MISENDKKRLENIKDGLKSIEANLDNLGFVYKIAGNLFRFSDSLEDKNLKSSLKGELAKIMQTKYKEEIQQAVKSIFSIISEISETEKEETKEISKKYIDVKQEATYRSERYEEDCEKYSLYTKNIIEVEKKILDSPYYQKKLHEKIEKHKTWKEYRHARLTGNLRIMYLYNEKEKKITFDAIITKNEFDKS